MTTIIILIIILLPILISMRVNLTYLELVGRFRVSLFILWKIKVVQFDVRTKGEFGIFVNGKSLDIDKMKGRKIPLDGTDIKAILSIFYLGSVELRYVMGQEDKMKANINFAMIGYLVESVLEQGKARGLLGEYTICRKLSYEVGQNYISINGNVKVKLVKLVKVSVGTLKRVFKNRSHKVESKSENYSLHHNV